MRKIKVPADIKLFHYGTGKPMTRSENVDGQVKTAEEEPFSIGRWFAQMLLPLATWSESRKARRIGNRLREKLMAAKAGEDLLMEEEHWEDLCEALEPKTKPDKGAPAYQSMAASTVLEQFVPFEDAIFLAEEVKE